MISYEYCHIRPTTLPADAKKYPSAVVFYIPYEKPYGKRYVFVGTTKDDQRFQYDSIDKGQTWSEAKEYRYEEPVNQSPTDQ